MNRRKLLLAALPVLAPGPPAFAAQEAAGPAREVVLRASVRHLDQGERALLAELQRAGERFDALFELQFGAEADGRGVWPVDLDAAELEDWIARHPEDEAALLDPHTAVRRAEGGLVAVPYHEAYRAELAEAAQALRWAAACCGDGSWRRFLRARAAALLDGDYRASETAWLAARPRRWACWFGPDSTAADDLRGVKAAFGGWIALPDPGSRLYLSRMEGALAVVDAELPSRCSGEIEPARVWAVNDLARFGGLRGNQRYLAILPIDEELRAAEGRVLVFAHNVYGPRQARQYAEYVERLLPPGAPTVRLEDEFRLSLGHYFAHGVGPQMARVDGETAELKEHFGELHGVLEESKAELLALRLAETVAQSEAGRGAPPAYKTILLVNGFKVLEEYQRGRAPERHGRCFLLLFGRLLRDGALEPTDAGWRLDPERAEESWRALAAEIVTIQDAGDLEAARELVDEAQWTPELERGAAAIQEVDPERIRPRFEFRGR